VRCEREVLDRPETAGEVRGGLVDALHPVLALRWWDY
jgi:hypothetical protein